MKSELTEKELLNQLAELPRKIVPENDVWPGILSRIERSSSSVPSARAASRWRYLGAAAAVFVAFGAGLLLGPGWFSGSMHEATDTSLASQASSRNDFPTSLATTLAATELEYQAAFKEYIAVGDTRDSLAPKTTEALLMSWDEMRKSETGLTLALQDNPANPFLNTKMLELRSRQLRFLKQIAVLDQNSRRTTI